MIETPIADRYEKLRKERRFVRTAVDVSVFADLLTKGVTDTDITVEGLPKDALFIAVERDVMLQAFLFVYAHESFSPVDPGVMPNTVVLTLTRKYYDPAKVDRLEVIDETGRAYVKGSIYKSPVSVDLSYQDDGKTLKVFVKEKK